MSSEGLQEVGGGWGLLLIGGRGLVEVVVEVQKRCYPTELVGQYLQ